MVSAIQLQRVIAPTILVDTWAWLALNYKGDQDYQRAQTANRELLEKNYNFVTTNFVLDETDTLLRRRAYAQRSVEFGREIQQVVLMGGLELVTITPDIEQDAWRIFEKYHEKISRFVGIVLHRLHFFCSYASIKNSRSV